MQLGLNLIFDIWSRFGSERHNECIVLVDINHVQYFVFAVVNLLIFNIKFFIIVYYSREISRGTSIHQHNTRWSTSLYRT